MYKGNFTCKSDVIHAFAGDGVSVEDMESNLRDAKILVAWYGYGDYDGSAFVLYSRGDLLYEVNGGHCSCYELEGQWDPELTSVEALRHRIENGNLGRDSYYDDCEFHVSLKRILTRWEKSSE